MDLVESNRSRRHHPSVVSRLPDATASLRFVPSFEGPIPSTGRCLWRRPRGDVGHLIRLVAYAGSWLSTQWSPADQLIAVAATFAVSGIVSAQLRSS